MSKNLVETLESRTLRSASLVGETLLVNGTTGNDTIVLTVVNGNDINVKLNGADQGTFDVHTTGPDPDDIEVHGLAGNDTITLDQTIKLHSFVYGEAGNDTINGGGGEDYIDAGLGNDSCHGGAGDDTFANPAYATTRFGLVDSDNYWGDSGTEDVVTYHGRAQGVVVTLDGVDNDGVATAIVGAASPEHDNVHTDVEGVIGTDSNDYLLGNLFDNNLAGYGGNDSVYGMEGHDTLTGGNGNDIIYGSDGNDWVMGDAGADYLSGGSNNDTIRGGDNSDTMTGGTGVDTVEYENTLSGVTASLDGVQNDGAAGENDWIQKDVENLTGSDFNDRLTGSSGANFLDGKNGNDTLIGGGGNDTLIGGFGNDSLHGNGGDDSLDGGYGDDTLWGDAGIDTLVDAQGTNVFHP
jgi:Ca2+-binding RTX toxin-like protein